MYTVFDIVTLCKLTDRALIESGLPPEGEHNDVRNMSRSIV